MTPDLAAELQRRLGSDLAVGTIPIGAAEPPHPDEEEPMVRMRAGRRAEFLAGRTAVRQALRALALPPLGIPMGPDRAPIWPKGVIGSIAHDERDAVAVVGHVSKHLCLGIDLEPAAPLPPDVSREVLTRGEPNGPGCESRAVFAVKETVFKAVYPLIGTIWPYTAVTVQLMQIDETYEATLNRPAGPFPAGTVVQGPILIRQGVILAGLALKRMTNMT